MTTEILRILLVEDNPADAELLQAMLYRIRWERFHFTSVDCLAEAIALIEQYTFDVLLLDLTLPDSTGPGTYQRAISAAPHLPIVVLTGDDNADVGLDAVRHGVQDYLVKGSIDGHQIARSIRYAIERKLMEEDLKRFHTELEARVRERTAELAQANEALQHEITERIRAEAKQITAVVEERTRIAREIHDTIAQGLTGIIIHLEAAECYQEQDPAIVRQRIIKAQQLARETLTEARRSVWALRPQSLEEGNLVTALSSLIERMARDSSVTIDFSHQGVLCSLPAEMEHDLLRLCQEALNNALKHAQAQHIHASLLYTDHQVELCVEDDGQGFDSSQEMQPHSFGLRIMKERIDRMHGQLIITSHPGHGTRVTVLVSRQVDW